MMDAITLSVLRRLRQKRIALLLTVHLLVFGAAYATAYLLRFDFAVPPSEQALFWKSLLWIVPLKLVVFHRLGSFQGWWRHVTFADLVTLLRASALATLTLAGVDYFLIGRYQISRAVVVLDCGATILLLGGLRSAWRLVREHIWPTLAEETRRPALMAGIDPHNEALVQQIHANRRLNYHVVGFLDGNHLHHGSSLGGVPFLGSPEQAVAIARRRKVRDILVVAHSISGRRLRELVDECRQAGIEVKMIPSLDDLLSNSYRLQVRDANINDLLRREPVDLDSEAIGRMLQGRRVMVTGAGGSIGAEICRQIAKYAPECLILTERAENNLFFIEQELRRTVEGVKLVPCVADITDQPRMRTLFRHFRPEIVFHAAAHKHVPLMESNPGEAIKNNVLGTQWLADMADQQHVERFVMISTDKAVNPSSVMGVSKQLAERYVHAYSETSATKFVVVRFGNVLASTGSAVPIFQEQIRRGGPITITHPDMKRFFMTILEASQLVLQAATMGRGGEIFVLDMGEPVPILDLARDLIRLSGLTPEEIEIEITGPRPGEKLCEKIYLEEEQTLPTPHPKLRVAYHRSCSLDEARRAILELVPLVNESAEVIGRKLRELMPDYCPPLPFPQLDRTARAAREYSTVNHR
jgi:FlaA1/EpsC-like NDP-sugar epimerase